MCNNFCRQFAVAEQGVVACELRNKSSTTENLQPRKGNVNHVTFKILLRKMLGVETNNERIAVLKVSSYIVCSMVYAICRMKL